MPPGSMSTLFRADDVFVVKYFEKYPVRLATMRNHACSQLLPIYVYGTKGAPVSGFYISIRLQQGYYDTMDTGMLHKNGYVSIFSRSDDVINVAGHRLSTSQIEEVGVSHNFGYSYFGPVSERAREN
ncbi:hypothetical protein MRX96_051045 [Rhipicephalus microplus]